MRLSGGHDRRVPHALARGARAGDLGRGRGRRRTDQGDGRHRLEQHRGGPAADPLGRQGQGRRRADRRPLLQQAHAGRLLISTFKVLAQAVDIPICVYNIPGRTGKNIEPETIVRMAELPNITMVKESTGSLDQASQIIGATDLTVLSGDDSLTLPLMSIGGRGVVSVVGNIVPEDVIAHVRAFESGNLAEARRWHHKLFPLCRDMLGLSTNPDPHQGRDADARPRQGDLVPAGAAQPRRRSEAADDARPYGLLKG